MSWWTDTLMVFNYDRESFTPTTKKKLNKYVTDNGIACNNYALFPFKPGREFTQWIPKDMIVDFEKVAAVKLPRSYNGGGRQANLNRIPGSYDVQIDGTVSYGVPADNIDQTKPIFYLVCKVDEAYRYGTPLNADYLGSTLVILSSNRLAKFTRSFPQAIEAFKAVQKGYKKWKRRLTENEKIAIALHHGGCNYDRYNLQALDSKLINDPALKRVCRIASNKQYDTACNTYCMYRSVTRTSVKDIIEDFTSPLAAYPLFNRSTLYADPDHIYTYLNALHAYLTKPGA